MTESEKSNINSIEQDDLFLIEEDDGSLQSHDQKWKVLIVDDEEDVHNVTRLSLSNFTFENKRISFLSGYSAIEGAELVKRNPDIAVILLDVVMETDDAGLRMAEIIRHEIKNHKVRIILRTGHPGQAPEDNVILQYDINDYKMKTELTAKKLFNSLVTAIRSYRDLKMIEDSKIHLEQLVSAYERFVPHEFLSFLDKKSIVDVNLGDQTQREMTILFNDIRGFTTLSEQMTPRENFAFINSYLSRMSPEIRRHNGFIDKYIGDAIMALFPNSAEDAVKSAIHMLNNLNDYNAGRKRAGYQLIQIGIGIHSGLIMLGTVGGKDRMDGTVISDTVNVASRIENLTKTYNVSLLISQQSLATLPNSSTYATRIIDKVKVKGKNETIIVYEIYSGDDPESIILKNQTLSTFEEGFLNFNIKEFSTAIQLFDEVLRANPNDTVADIYRRRCEHFIQYGVPENWDGVTVMYVK